MWEPQTPGTLRACPDIVTGTALPFPLQLCGIHKHKFYEVNGYTSVQYEVYCKVSGFLLVMNYGFLSIIHNLE